MLRERLLPDENDSRQNKPRSRLIGCLVITGFVVASWSLIGGFVYWLYLHWA